MPFRQYIFGIFFVGIFLAQNNHVPQNQTFGLQIPNSFLVLSDKVSEFRQTVRQVLSGIQTIALLALYLLLLRLFDVLNRH